MVYSFCLLGRPLGRSQVVGPGDTSDRQIPCGSEDDESSQ